MRTGRCLCGAVTYELSGEPIATAVCHCEHCQRQSGAAFSVNLVVHQSQLALSGELSTYEERGERNDDVYVRRRFCPKCGSPVVSELSKTDGIIAVKAGTLDDRSDVRPVVEVWCVDRQPWVSLPGMAVSLERESA
ncbi:MAG: GFA family protein [Actinomycetota bacterium]